MLSITPVSTPAIIAEGQPPLERKHTLTGDIRTHADFGSRFLKKPHTTLVYLPPGYSAPENTGRRYPVLYLADGQNVFDGATSYIPGKEWQVDETAERLMSSGQVEPTIIVAVYNTGVDRAYEYTPTRDERIGGGTGGGADEYGRFLVEELKPFIDKTYRTLTDADHTGLGGSSLGGLLTLHLGLKYPNVFRRLAVVSPSVWWDKREILQAVRAIKQKPPLRIWVDIGGKEGKRAVDDARDLRDALQARGWSPNRDLHYMEDLEAAHDEAAWAGRVEPILKFLFPPK